MLRAYLAEIRGPAAAAALFAEDGVLELPKVGARAQGPAAIEKLIAGLLEKVPARGDRAARRVPLARGDVRPDFRFQNIQIFIETPEQAFGEYDVDALVPSTGKIYKQTYAGRLVAEGGKIKLLREALDTLAAREAFRKDGRR